MAMHKFYTITVQIFATSAVYTAVNNKNANLSQK